MNHATDQTDSDSFESRANDLGGIAAARERNGVNEIDFLLAFVTERDNIDEITAAAVSSTEQDPIIWFACPKGSARR